MNLHTEKTSKDSHLCVPAVCTLTCMMSMKDVWCSLIGKMLTYIHDTHMYTHHFDHADAQCMGACIYRMHDGHSMLPQQILLSMLKYINTSETWTNADIWSINGEIGWWVVCALYWQKKMKLIDIWVPSWWNMLELSLNLPWKLRFRGVNLLAT